MPYCPNCGTETKDKYRYCVGCGEALEGSDPSGPSSSSNSNDGFLSPRSYEYITDIIEGERELDQDDPDYSVLAKDVTRGIGEMGIVASLDGIDMISMLASQHSRFPEITEDPENLSKEEQDAQLIWLGFLRTPELYDKTLGTDWREEVAPRLKEVLDTEDPNNG